MQNYEITLRICLIATKLTVGQSLSESCFMGQIDQQVRIDHMGQIPISKNNSHNFIINFVAA